MSEFSNRFERVKDLGWNLLGDERVILDGDEVKELEELFRWAYRTIGRLEAQCEHKDGEEFHKGDRVVIERSGGEALAGEITRISEGGIGIPAENERATAIASWRQILALVPPEDYVR